MPKPQAARASIGRDPLHPLNRCQRKDCRPASTVQFSLPMRMVWAISDDKMRRSAARGKAGGHTTKRQELKGAQSRPLASVQAHSVSGMTVDLARRSEPHCSQCRSRRPPSRSRLTRVDKEHSGEFMSLIPGQSRARKCYRSAIAATATGGTVARGEVRPNRQTAASE